MKTETIQPKDSALAYLEGPYLITICKDGHLSLLEKGKKGQRRLGSALAVIGVDSVEEGMMLIQELSFLTRVQHGPKTGCLIEPFYRGWPLRGEADLEHVEAAKSEFLKLRDSRRRTRVTTTTDDKPAVFAQTEGRRRRKLQKATADDGREYVLAEREQMGLVPCTGEAHKNPFIDHCALCMGHEWGRMMQYKKIPLEKILGSDLAAPVNHVDYDLFNKMVEEDKLVMIPLRTKSTSFFAYVRKVTP